jgi:anti-sigma factor RsiW
MRQPEVRCVEFVEQVTEWLEGGLTDDERALFEEHLAYCSPCGRYVAQFRETLVLAREGELVLGAAPPPAVMSALLDAFSQHRRR